MKRPLRSLIIALAIPLAYALLVRLLFGLDPIKDFLTVMSLSFFITVPFGIGYLTVTILPLEQIRRRRYQVLAPWAPVILFLLFTVLLYLEGWACWVMALPLFLIFSSIGGLVAGARRLRRKGRSDKLQVSLILFLPFLLTPLEKLLPVIPVRYEAYTFTDIHAPAARIWGNLVRVPTIPEAADHGTLTRFLGFPRPVRAELDHPGVGGSRQAIFTRGLVFKETVTEYQDQKSMHFSIKANPHTIPSTTMDEHVIIGGNYFDVLDGTYVLQPLNDSVYRLHLYSHFTLKTTFNFYANWWAGMIMKDIQNNILQVIKTRCEGNL